MGSRTRSSRLGAYSGKLGAVVADLGQREIGTSRLEQAAEICRDALKEFTRKRSPHRWCKVQFNLGCIIATIGFRNGDKASLKNALKLLSEVARHTDDINRHVDKAQIHQSIDKVKNFLKYLL